MSPLGVQPVSRRSGSWTRRLRRVSRVRAGDIRGLWWARAVLRTARRDLDVSGTALRLRTPDPGERHLALPVLEAYLRLRRATCLERTYVVQRFLAANDIPVPVVIGVKSDDGAVAAHAWLDGYDPPSQSEGYREITRVAP